MPPSTNYTAPKLPSLYASAPSLFTSSSRLVSTSSRGNKASQKNAPAYPKLNVQKKRHVADFGQFHYNYDTSPFSQVNTCLFNEVIGAINEPLDSGSHTTSLRPYYLDYPAPGKRLSVTIDEAGIQVSLGSSGDETITLRHSARTTAALRVKKANRGKVVSSKAKQRHLPKNEPVDDLDIADPFGLKEAAAILKSELFGDAESGKAPAANTDHLSGAKKELVEWAKNLCDEVCVKIGV